MSQTQIFHSSEKVIRILYEDDYYVIFDKPAGLLVIPTPKNESNTLVNIVNNQYGRKQEGQHLHPCHRLDRETSGAIIFARGKRCQKLMMELFRQRLIKKKYVAYIHGRLAKHHGELKSLIKDLDQRKYKNMPSAQWAVTAYRVLEEKRLFSVVEVEPVTGQTNQIRIHFSESGHPLVGDRKYAFARDYALKFRRTALHACRLEFSHPITHEQVVVTSDLPEDMQTLAFHEAGGK